MLARILSTMASVVAALLAAGNLAAAADFRGLGDLAGGDFGSAAVAVSGDGMVVVGSSTTATGQQAFRWTAAGGMVGLPKPLGINMTWASAVSADGAFVAGWGGNSFQSPIGWEGIRWGTDGTLDRLAVPGDGVWAKGISGDGSIVVGGAADHAFKWTTADGFTELDGLYELARGNAEGISADGSVIVGSSIDPVHSVADAFRWTADGGPLGLGAYTATAASADGSVVVGTVVGPQHFQAFRWTAQTGVVPLETLGDDHHARAMGVSADGSVVVGYRQSDATDLQEAFVWEAATGMRLVRDVLAAEFGVDTPGWELNRTLGVSADGKTLVGNGRNAAGDSEAWMAVLLDSGDADKDGDVDIFDMAKVQVHYGAPCGMTWSEGDFNADGSVDIFDVAELQRNYGHGVSGSTVAVPEPTTIVLLGLGLAVLGVAVLGWIIALKRRA